MYPRCAAHVFRFFFYVAVRIPLEVMACAVQRKDPELAKGMREELKFKNIWRQL